MRKTDKQVNPYREKYKVKNIHSCKINFDTITVMYAAL